MSYQTLPGLPQKLISARENGVRPSQFGPPVAQEPAELQPVPTLMAPFQSDETPMAWVAPAARLMLFLMLPLLVWV
jgi:hypothetical protein